MTVHLDHTIVPATDKRASAAFLGDILGIPVGNPWGPFAPLPIGNGVTLDFMDAGEVSSHHYAFLVDDREFDPIFQRIRDRQVAFYADPGRSLSGQINHRFGDRGLYFDDPDGHLMEILTRPNAVAGGWPGDA